MAQFIKKYNFDSTKVSALVYEDTYPGYVWVAFEAHSPDECRLIKASTFNLHQITFDIPSVPVGRINKIITDSFRVVLAVDDDTLMGYRYSQFSPFGTNNAVLKPVGIVENAIDVLASSTRHFYLFPGSATGTNAKIAVTDKNGNHLQTIDLIPSATGSSPIVDAVSMVLDANDDIWVVTNTSPVMLARVYDTGGEVFDVQAHQII